MPMIKAIYTLTAAIIIYISATLYIDTANRSIAKEGCLEADIIYPLRADLMPKSDQRFSADMEPSSSRLEQVVRSGYFGLVETSTRSFSRGKIEVFRVTYVYSYPPSMMNLLGIAIRRPSYSCHEDKLDEYLSVFKVLEAR